MRIFKKSVYFLFESGSLDSPGGPSSNRRYSITGVLRRRVIMNFTSKGPAEAKSTITLRRIHLIRRPYAKRRGRRETMFDCPLSKTVKIRLLPLASYCADATERRASAAPKATEIHKTRNPRPFTGPFFGPYMHPNRPLDLKIVFNRHPKPPNGITNVFRFSAHSWVVHFLFLFR